MYSSKACKLYSNKMQPCAAQGCQSICEKKMLAKVATLFEYLHNLNDFVLFLRIKCNISSAFQPGNLLWLPLE